MAWITTPAELQAWRARHSLTVAELAMILGISQGGVEKKLYGSRPLRGITRQVEAIELLLAAGIEPPAWPKRRGPRNLVAWRTIVERAALQMIAEQLARALPEHPIETFIAILMVN